MHSLIGDAASGCTRGSPYWATGARCALGRLPGGDAGGATPVPIPNTVVKPSRADGTALVTVWESRSLPGVNRKRRGGFFTSPLSFFEGSTRSPDRRNDERGEPGCDPLWVDRLVHPRAPVRG